MTVTTFMESGSDATQDLTFWGTATGDITSSNAVVHTGNRSIKCNVGSPVVATNLNSPANICLDSGTQISLWVYLTALPTVQGAPFTIIDNAGNNVFRLLLNTSGTITNAPFGGTAVAGTSALSAGAWARISISYYITDTTHFQFNVYVGGALDSTANAGTLTRTGSNKFKFGIGGAFAVNSILYASDVYVATGGASSSAQPDTGDIRVAAKRPNANGTTNGFTTQIGSGGSGYGTGHSPQVNEQPLSVTNGWSMVGAGVAVTEEYNIENSVTGSSVVNGNVVDIAGWLYASSLLSETGQMVLNGVNSNIALTSTNTLFEAYAGATAYPAATGADIGIITSTTVTTVSLFECGVLIAFTPVSIAPMRMMMGMGN